MRLRSALMLALCSYACGGPDPISYERQVPVSNKQSALVRWTLQGSSCPGDEVLPPEFENSGTIAIEGDQIEIGLNTMPVLTGRIEADRARISGVTTFWQEDWVTCTVTGEANLQPGLVVAQVNEALSSQSALNCSQEWRLQVEY